MTINQGLILKVLFLLIFMPGLLYAAPCYGPNMPTKGKWDVGSEVNIVFERKLEKSHGEFKTNQYFITLSYGFWDWLCFDGKVGAGHIKQKPETGDEINYTTNFSGAYGFRIRAYQNETKNIRIITGFQHISVHPDSRDVDGAKNEAILDDWQGSVLIAKDYEHISPYCGVKVSGHDLIHKIAGERGRKKSDDLFGVFAGADIYLNDSFRLNLEGRFLDETAASLALIHKF